MGPKPDTDAIHYVRMRTIGGEVGSSAVLAPRLGPLGVPPKKAGDEIAKATQAWKGIKIMVSLKIQNRQVTCEIIPTATSMIIKALKEPTRDRKKVKNIKHNGNLDFDTIVDIAKQMRAANRGILSKSLKGTVKEVLGTCVAVGCTVDNKKPTEIQAALETGEYVVPSE